MSLETALKEYNTLTEEDRNRFKEIIDDRVAFAQLKESERRLKLYEEGKISAMTYEEQKLKLKERYGLYSS